MTTKTEYGLIGALVLIAVICAEGTLGPSLKRVYLQHAHASVQQQALPSTPLIHDFIGSAYGRSYYKLNGVDDCEEDEDYGSTLATEHVSCSYAYRIIQDAKNRNSR